MALGSLVLLAYGAALGAGYYSDDFQWLARMAPTLERPLYVFSIFYRDFNPLLHASFLLDYLAGGGAAAVFHATSLLVHAINTILLYFLCRRHTAQAWMAAAAALTWGLNARLSEAVIWPAARGHSLATLFVLAALLCLGSEAPRRRWLSTPLFLLALLSKEVAFFPMLLAPLFTRDRRRSRWILGTLGLMAAAFVAFNMAFKPDLRLSQDGAATLALKIPFILLRPLGLGDVYDFSWPMMALVSLAFAGGAVLLRRTAGSIGLLWLLVCLVPIVPLAQLSSRYLYLLSIGYALAMCGAWDALTPLLESPATRRAVSALAVTGLTLLAATGVLHIAREIEDYDLLSRPYQVCLDALRDEARLTPPGVTLVVIDISDRRAVPELNRLIAERGGMTKLIPYRPLGVGGLIDLPDILNIVAAGGGMLATNAESGAAQNARVLVYDGRHVRPALAPPARALPSERVLAARLAPAQEFFK